MLATAGYYVGDILAIFWRFVGDSLPALAMGLRPSVIAAAGGRQHLQGSVQEHWWPTEDARESTLTSKVEVAFRRALGELKIDMNVDILTPTRAATLVCTIVRLVEARTKRIKRKWRKSKG